MRSGAQHHTITMCTTIFESKDIWTLNTYNGHDDLEPWYRDMTHFVAMTCPGIDCLQGIIGIHSISYEFLAIRNSYRNPSNSYRNPRNS